MEKRVRKFIPQKAINLGKHLPTAVLANLKYGFPSRKLKVIGVSGTDGKTTTVSMIYHILKHAGKKVSMVSTTGAIIGDKKYPVGFHVTSPSPFAIQKFFSEAIKNGSEYMVLEITSHALDQYRSLGVKFDVGVITNVTHEHLDYHKSFENYLNTKAKLIKNVRVAVLNKEEAGNFEKLTKKTFGKVVGFGLKKSADFNPRKFPLKLKITGEYNFLNALAAGAVCVNLGVGAKLVKEALLEFVLPTGRMEEVPNNLGIKIIIDFAHTPNGLENAIKAIKGKGRLIALIGAEGYRDEGKRAMMGQISVENADVTIITSVDPRGLIDKINEQILEGVKRAGGVLVDKNLADKNVFISEGKKLCFIENDRKKAIEFAVNKLAKKGDTVGIFGKGHESSMNIDGKKELPWSDKSAVSEVLEKK